MLRRSASPFFGSPGIVPVIDFGEMRAARHQVGSGQASAGGRRPVRPEDLLHRCFLPDQTVRKTPPDYAGRIFTKLPPTALKSNSPGIVRNPA